MADGYDRFDNEGGGGGSFVMGLLTGTVLGAGLGMLFAPKAGSELRNQLSEQAGNLANTASEGYRARVGSRWRVGREGPRDGYDKASDAVSRRRRRGAALRARGDERRRAARREAPRAARPATSAESIRGGSVEQIRGAGTPGSGESIQPRAAARPSGSRRS